ncbi:hypothetical protein EMPS_07530 [Entomortierella parvispora]|uniref:Uncharacterized protein n=1 Tax=Entomortierella parvispora TaxID=205924 RepID=A0A9P3LYI6_9FUNG|nr:hypothetical protein EMPS_07530 [Entomortierella parvispora]
MKPQLGHSKLSILKHAPSVHRKRRPVELRGKQGSSTESPSNATPVPGGGLTSTTASDHRPGGLSTLRRTLSRSSGAFGGGSINHVHHHHHHQGGPPSLLRRQTTARHKSFMEVDLPSMRVLRREPTMMELDPPATLFAPAPTPSHFQPGPWAFFQAAEAQREQRQSQIEFLTKLQELRVRDEQLFVQLMAGFAKECPVQFTQLTGFMKRMEMEMAAEEQQQQHTHQLQQQQHHLQLQQDAWMRMMSAREDRGTKTGLMSLAQTFGKSIQSVGTSHRDQFFSDQQQQQRQLWQQQQQGHQHGQNLLLQQQLHNQFHSTGGQIGAGTSKPGRPGGAQRRHTTGGGGAATAQARPVPQLRRGKTFQQQQQALQQLTSYQRQLYQQVQQTHLQQQHLQQQQQQQGWPGNNFGSTNGVPLVTSPTSIPLAHELMQYAAMQSLGNSGSLPPFLLGNQGGVPSLSTSPLTSPALNGHHGSNSLSPVTPPLGGFSFGGIGAGDPQHLQQHLQQKRNSIDPLELAAQNMQMNLNSQGSSRRSRYKPPPLRTH